MLSMAAAISRAEFPLTVQVVSVAVPGSYTPPPRAGGVAADRAVGERRCAVDSTGRRRAPAELPLTVQSVSVRRADVLQAAADEPAELPLMVQSVSVAVPRFSMPPPPPTVEPPVMVRPESVAVTPLSTSKTRLWPRR